MCVRGRVCVRILYIFIFFFCSTSPNRSLINDRRTFFGNKNAREHSRWVGEKTEEEVDKEEVE